MGRNRHENGGWWKFEQPLTTVGQLPTAIGESCFPSASIDHLWWVKGLEVSDFNQL